MRATRTRIQAGFTLLEILVVLTIAALLLVVVPPMLNGSMESAEFKSSVRDLAAGMRLARSSAIVENRSVAVILDVKDRSFQITDSGEIRHFPQDLSVTLNTASSEMIDENRGAIRFFPDGSATGGSVVLQAKNQALEVSVDWLTGRISISDKEGVST